MTHNLSKFGYFMWHDFLENLFNLKKKPTVPFGWVDNLHSLDGLMHRGVHRTGSHVPNFSETWTWYLNHRVGCSLKRRGWVQGESRDGVFPSVFLTCDSLFFKLITTCTRDTRFYPLVLLIIFLNVGGRRHQLSQTKILHINLPKTFRNQQSPRIHAFMFE